MTDRELMQQALEALEIESKGYADKVARNRGIITALRERLAQSEQEPVVWRWLYGGKPEDDTCFPMPGPDADLVERGALCRIPVTPQYLYTTPQPRQWQGLTEEEIIDQFQTNVDTGSLLSFTDGARYAEAKLREKNA